MDNSVGCYEPEILSRYDKKVNQIKSISQNQYTGTITICLTDGERIWLTPKLSLDKLGIKPEIEIEFVRDFFPTNSGGEIKEIKR